MTLIPYIAEKLLRIQFPFGVKLMIPFALFMHTAGGIDATVLDVLGFLL